MIEMLMNTFITVWLLAAITLTAAIPFCGFQMLYWAWRGDKQ